MQKHLTVKPMRLDAYRVAVIANRIGSVHLDVG
jgi:hypothetical protein